MTNVLVTGSNGQLGSELRSLVEGEAEATHPGTVSGCAPSGAPKINYFFTDRSNLDISDFDLVKEYIRDKQINVIINCAAYTAVDKAEDDAINADKINHLAVKYLAQIAKEKDLRAKYGITTLGDAQVLEMLAQIADNKENENA